MRDDIPCHCGCSRSVEQRTEVVVVSISGYPGKRAPQRHGLRRGFSRVVVFGVVSGLVRYILVSIIGTHLVWLLDVLFEKLSKQFDF